MGSNIETFLHPPPGRVIQVHSRLRSLLETVTKEMEEAFPTGMASSQRDELLRTEAVYSAAIEDETDPNRVSLHHRALAGFLEQPLGERSLLDLHRGMMEGQPHAAPGMYRSIQVTIGQHRPPSPALIPSLMRELMDFLLEGKNDREGRIARAVWANVEYETVHPFADGNGRTGRAIVTHLLDAPVPLSRFIFTERPGYYRLFQHGGWPDWLEWMARGILEEARRARDEG